MSRPASPTRSAGTAVLFGAAIIVLALCLRAGVGSLSVLLGTVREALGFSPAGVSMLTTLPPLCFAIVGIGTGRLILRFGIHRVAVTLLAAIAVGLTVRALVDSWLLFLLATAVAMGGAAVGNVVLPPLAKKHFPDQVPLISALYGAAVVGGATLASSATVPISDAFGGWRVGLGAWAVLAVVALVLWLPTLFERDQPGDPAAVAGGATTGAAPHRITLGQIARTPLGWAFMVCFGVQASQAYVQFGWWGEILTDAGADDAHAGLLLGAITGVGIPVTLALPALIRLTRGGIVLPVLFSLATVIGWVGLLVAPLAAGGWLWSTLLGFGGGAFTWVLAMLAQRTRTHDGTAQLSALTQGAGYLVASTATFLAGIGHDATGSWDAPILMAIVLAVLIGVSGAVIARSGPLEDQLGERAEVAPRG